MVIPLLLFIVSISNAANSLKGIKQSTIEVIIVPLADNKATNLEVDPRYFLQYSRFQLFLSSFLLPERYHFSKLYQASLHGLAATVKPSPVFRSF